MRVNGCVFENRAIRQPKLSADGCAGEELALAIVIIIHGESTAGLYIHNPLHHGIPQAQRAAVFHHNAHAAEDLHVHQRQIAAVRNIEGLGDFPCLHLFPFKIIAQIAIGAAFVGAVPCLEAGGNTNRIFLARHIAAELRNCPRLHDVPHIFAVLCLGQILFADLIRQRLLTGVYPEGQRIAGCCAPLIISDGHGDQICTGILGGAAEGQAAAQGHIDALHAAVALRRSAVFRIRHNIHRGLAALHLNLRKVIQLLPVLILRLLVALHQCAVYGYVAVLIAGRRAGCSGNAVILLLAGDGSLKAALQLDIQMVGIALAIVLRQSTLAGRIHHQLHGQVFIALGLNGDHVAALEHGDLWLGAEIHLGEYQLLMLRVLLIASAGGRCIGLFPPCGTIDRDASDGGQIALIGEAQKPIVTKGIHTQRNLTQRQLFQ